MNEHLTAEMLNLLARGTVPEAALAATLRHLRECRACARGAEVALQPAVDALQETFAIDGESPHIDPETQLAQYVDGTLAPADREVVETHLEECAMCRAEVDDLLSLAKPPTRRRRTLLFAAAVAAAIAITVFLLTWPRTVVKPPQAKPPELSVVTTAETATEGMPARRYENKEWERLVREALHSGRLPLADLRAISGAADPLRGQFDPSADGLAPAGVVVDDVRPRFSWPPSPSATYVVTIFDGEQEVAQSDTLTAAHWTPRTALRRGRVYVWQVAVATREATAILPAPPAPQATFLIASERDHRELAEARRLFPDDHVLHAVLAARAGLRAEAEEALSRADVKFVLP
ncbi:MAG TPA: zf-HC2 domain-containing protein [Thermoanaerobaculia bacterium]|nr:zf-HC2 domain-containing protein [Thermoanaerobaculia bacterium]